MTKRRKHKKKPDRAVTAVQLNLETEGFKYCKWGGEQRCKSGDWLVSNEGDVYTVDRKVFARTYAAVSPGRYVKSAPVWAEVADESGSIVTKEGCSHYSRGDYLVFNEKDGTEAVCMSQATFEELYELAEVE